MKHIIYILVILTFIFSCDFSKAQEFGELEELYNMVDKVEEVVEEVKVSNFYIPVSLSPALFSKLGYVYYASNHYVNLEIGFLSSKVNLGDSLFGHLMKLEPSLKAGILISDDKSLTPYLSAETSFIINEGKGISFKSDAVINFDDILVSRVNFTGSMFYSVSSLAFHNDYLRGYVSYKTQFVNLNNASNTKDYFLDSFRKLFEKKNGLILGVFYQKNIVDKYAISIEYSRKAQSISLLYDL